MNVSPIFFWVYLWEFQVSILVSQVNTNRYSWSVSNSTLPIPSPFSCMKGCHFCSTSSPSEVYNQRNIKVEKDHQDYLVQPQPIPSVPLSATYACFLWTSRDGDWAACSNVQPLLLRRIFPNIHAESRRSWTVWLRTGPCLKWQPSTSTCLTWMWKAAMLWGCQPQR